MVGLLPPHERPERNSWLLTLARPSPATKVIWRVTSGWKIIIFSSFCVTVTFQQQASENLFLFAYLFPHEMQTLCYYMGSPQIVRDWSAVCLITFSFLTHANSQVPRQTDTDLDTATVAINSEKYVNCRKQLEGTAGPLIAFFHNVLNLNHESLLP